MRDMHNGIEVRVAVNWTRVTDNTAQVGNIIDLANCDMCEFVVGIGALADADATFTVLVEDGANAALSDAAAVADALLLGTEAGASFTFADDNEARKIGYIGAQRYVRMTITPAANTGNADFGAVALLSRRVGPQSSQG